MNHHDRENLKRMIRKAILSGSDFLGKKMSDRNRNGWFRDPDIIDMPEEAPLYEHKPGVKALGILLAVLGYGCGGTTLLVTLVILWFTTMMGAATAGMVLVLVNLLFIGGFGFLAWKGTSTIGSVNRFQAYVKTLGDEEMCNIRQLAQRVGKKDKFVVRDVEKMIQKGWFSQGHLDDKKTCLMVTDHIYREYQRLEAERARHLLEEEERRKRMQAEAERQKKEAERQKKAEAEQQKMAEAERRKAEKEQAAAAGSRKNLSPEARKVVEQGDSYVKKIRRCNDAIPGKVVSAKIDRMEHLVDKIFDRVEQKPHKVGEIRKLMEYYLPTTVKLLETYAEMDAQPVGGENIQTAKKEIEDMLDTINIAFEKLLDSLFQDAAWDVSSDISVLNTMLAQEGLKEDGLKK